MIAANADSLLALANDKHSALKRRWFDTIVYDQMHVLVHYDLQDSRWSIVTLLFTHYITI